MQQLTLWADDPAVLELDVQVWLLAVPGIDPASPAAAAYVRDWDVRGKIARAQAAGTWPPDCRPWNARSGVPRLACLTCSTIRVQGPA